MSVAVSKGHIALCKLEMEVVVIKEQKPPPLSLQGKTKLLMSIYGVSGEIKIDILQINAHTNKRPTPRVRITPKHFIIYKKKII